MIRGDVFVEAGAVFLGELGETAEVHVVLEVGKLDSDGNWVGCGAGDEILVRLAIPFCVAVERFENVGRKAALLQLFSSPGSVFEDVVQDGDDHLVLGAQAHHDAERVEDVGLAFFWSAPAAPSPFGFPFVSISG